MTYVPTIHDLDYLLNTQPQFFDSIRVSRDSIDIGLNQRQDPWGISTQESVARLQYDHYRSNGGPELTESPIPPEERINYGGLEEGDGRQSLVGGFVACVWEEIVGLFELAYALVQLRAEIALAADGRLIDLDAIQFWNGFNLPGDLRDVARLLDIQNRIENGDQSELLDIEGEQHEALLGVRAKLRALKTEFEKLGEATVDFFAAWDVHIADEEYGFSVGPSLFVSGRLDQLLSVDLGDTPDEIKDTVTDVRNVDLVLPQNVNAAMCMISEALSDAYSEAEWQMRAQRGLSTLQGLVNQMVREAEENPWGTAGRAICIIALTIVPVAALARVARVLKRVFVDIDANPIGVDIDDSLRRATDAERNGTNANDTPDPDTTPDPEADTTPDSDDIIEPEEPGDTTNAKDPTARPTPPTDADTTNVPETDAERRARERAEQGERARRAGDFAEADARRRLTDAGYDVFVLENSLGHGPDIIAVRDGRIRIIEVKANGGEFTPAQSLGGPGYIRDVFNRIDNGIGPRDWNTTDLDNFMEANGIRSRQDLYDAEYELWRYRDVDGDDASSVTRPSTAPWTPGSPAQQFEIDADGVKYNLNDDGSRRGPMRRPWQDIVEN